MDKKKGTKFQKAHSRGGLAVLGNDRTTFFPPSFSLFPNQHQGKRSLQTGSPLLAAHGRTVSSGGPCSDLLSLPGAATPGALSPALT